MYNRVKDWFNLIRFRFLCWVLGVKVTIRENGEAIELDLTTMRRKK